MANHPFYKLALWQRLRTAQLQNYPLCEWCGNHNKITPATVVHHKIAHRGDWGLFSDADNLASLCKLCHDREAQKIERRGYDHKIGDDGWPSDPAHPFNRKR